MLNSCYIDLFSSYLPSENTDITKLIPHKWYTVYGDESTKSADGSDYFFYVKRGSSDKLLVYFDGGGVAWDNDSAASPMETWNLLDGSGNYFQSLYEWKIFTLDGLLLNSSKNPFYDWNVVFISYSSGDFHAGKADFSITRSDGSKALVHFNGQNNVQAALDWTYAAFEKPEKVFVAGSSAGAFGSSFWLSTLAKQYSEAPFYQLADGAYLLSDRWPGVAEDLWKADWENTFGFSPAADLIGAALEHNASSLGSRLKILQSHSLYDTLLSVFQARINGKENSISRSESLSEWSSLARAAVKNLAADYANYYYFISDYARAEDGSTPHTYSESSLSYEITQDGKNYMDWLDDAVNKDQYYSVGSQFLP